MFSLNLTFGDGSNPYFKREMTTKEFAEELLKWSKNYILLYETSISHAAECCIMFMHAIPRGEGLKQND